MSLRVASWVFPALLVCVITACGGQTPSTKNDDPAKRAAVVAPPDAALTLTPSTPCAENRVCVSWKTVAAADGFFFLRDGKRESNTWDGTRTFAVWTKLAGQHTYTVAAIGRDRAGTLTVPPAPVTPPTPPVTTTVPASTTLQTTTIPPPPVGFQVSVTPAGSDGNCGRNGAPCATVKKAYEVAQPGDTVQVGCGSYGSTTFAARKPAGPQVTFRPEKPLCVTLAYLDFTFGGDYSRFSGFNIVDQHGAIYQGGTVYSYGVTFDANLINVGKRVDEQNINLHLPNGWKFLGNTIGPSCCGAGSASPEGLRIGCYPCDIVSKNVVIDGNTIQGTVRYCLYWMTSYGPCPSPTPTLAPPKLKLLLSGRYGDCAACHADGIHVWGMTDSVISNNKVLGVEVQGIFIEPTSGSVQKNIAITGNTVSVVGGNAGIYVKTNATSTTGGTWTIADNKTSNLIEFSGGFTGAFPGTVFNVTGNTAQLLIADSNGNNAGCTGYPSTVKINFSRNVWLPVGGGTVGCG